MKNKFQAPSSNSQDNTVLQLPLTGLADFGTSGWASVLRYSKATVMKFLTCASTAQEPDWQLPAQTQLAKYTMLLRPSVL